jgi:WD40 repeat protein/mono/diheme cytochrome c family protein
MMRVVSGGLRALAWAGAVVMVSLCARGTGAADGGSQGPVSFEKQVMPILQANCAGCHQPGKLKGGLDVTTYKTLMAGGKDGLAVKAGDSAHSSMVKMVSGKEPEMPQKGEPLTKAEVEILAKWVDQGAKDDTTAVAMLASGATPGPAPLPTPPVYTVAPIVSALAWSPDGKLLAVSGYYEVILVSTEDWTAAGRLVGGSPRILSLAFSADGKKLAVAGGSPGQFGNVQIWDVPSRKLSGSWKVSGDTVFGINFNAAGDQVAFGCTDKSARVVSVADGKELMRLDQHSDWCLGALFTADGKRILTCSRDQAMKLSTLANGQFIDDINNPLEPVLCFARHPKEEVVVCGGGMGTPRIYKISDNQNRTAAKNDTNLVKELERQPGPVSAVAFSPDGTMVAAGSEKEARVHDAKTGSRLSTLSGHEGGIFAVAFSPDSKFVVTGGYDGVVRVFEAKSGKVTRGLVAVPLSMGRTVTAAAKN